MSTRIGVGPPRLFAVSRQFISKRKSITDPNNAANRIKRQIFDCVVGFSLSKNRNIVTSATPDPILARLREFERK